MGRPAQKRQFGDPAAIAGNQLFMFGDIGAGVEQVWVVSQRSTSIFLVESVATPGNQGEILLVNGPDAVTGVGFGYLGGNSEVDSATVVDTGGSYDVADTVTLTGGTGTDAILTVALVTPVNAQDETSYVGSFTGGDGVGTEYYQVNDVLTMSDGTKVTVDSVDTNGDVATFTVNSTTTTAGLTTNATITQFSKLGNSTDTNFSMTLADANQGIWSVTVTTAGDYTRTPTNPVSQGSTSGTGSAATFNLVTSRSSKSNYVSLLSNKNLKTFGQVGGRQSYLINADGADINIPGA